MNEADKIIKYDNYPINSKESFKILVGMKPFIRKILTISWPLSFPSFSSSDAKKLIFFLLIKN